MNNWRWVSAVVGGCLSVSALALEDKVVVLTTYSQEVSSRFEAAFEQAHPGTRVEVLWRSGRDALPVLRQSDQGGVDVVWGALSNHRQAVQTLAEQGEFVPLPLDEGLPSYLGPFPLRSAEGRLAASEVAGYGIAYNTQYLQQHQLAVPQDWHDLTSAAYHGHSLIPIPSRVGFAPALYETLLQHYGWEAGWQLIAELAGNAQLFNSGGVFIGDEIGSARRGAALTIDFLAQSAAANGRPVAFSYPPITGYSPSHLAITRAASHPQAARAFAEFVLSEAGQRLLSEPDIRKLPVRPSVYASLGMQYFNPFAAAQQHPQQFDAQLADARIGLDAALFDVALVEAHPELATLWQQLQALEQRCAANCATLSQLQALRKQLGQVPLSAEQAQNERYLAQFERLEGAAGVRAPEAELQRWREFFTQQRQQVQQQLKQLEAQL